MEINSYSKEYIREMRLKIKEMVENSIDNRKINLYLPVSLLEEIIFDKMGKKRILVFPLDILKRIDLHGVSFDYVEISGMDFSELEGIYINPQTIPSQIYQDGNSLYDIRKIFNTRKIQCDCLVNHDLSNCNFKGVTFTGSFDNCLIINSNFSGSFGVEIDPQKLKTALNIRNAGFINKQEEILLPITNCVFDGVSFIGSFDNCQIINSNFSGSYGAVIELQKLHKMIFNDCQIISVLGCDLTDTKVIGPLYNVVGMNEEMYYNVLNQDKTLFKRK